MRLESMHEPRPDSSNDGDSPESARNLARVLRAAVALRAGNPEAGLKALGPRGVQTPARLMFGASYIQPYQRFRRAELLLGAGELGPALRQFGTFSAQHVHHLIYLAPSHLRRARIHRSLSDRETASYHRERAHELWRHADSPLEARLDGASSQAGKSRP